MSCHNVVLSASMFPAKVPVVVCDYSYAFPPVIKQNCSDVLCCLCGIERNMLLADRCTNRYAGQNLHGTNLKFDSIAHY